MHYDVMPSDRSHLQKCYSLAECEGYARENGVGTYPVVVTTKRFGQDSESELWGNVIHRPDGSIVREKSGTDDDSNS